MLKTIEEPPASTHFVVLADFVPVDLVTISSRCVRVEFTPIPPDVLTARLFAEGVNPAMAKQAAASSGGNLDRARLLAADPDFAERRELFATLPRRLDGSGAAVVAATAELLAHIEAAAAPLTARQGIELAELDEREQRLGTRGSGRAALEARHKREQRRHRTDELRSGLAVLAGSYRDALVDGSAHHPDAVADAVHRIHVSIEALDSNPNESLMLQSLLWSLPVLAG
jgi:DNA polymerase-3 subunit delta'